MGELLDLLLSLSGLGANIYFKDTAKGKQRQASVFRWLRGLDKDVRNRVQRAPGPSKGVSDFVGILQFVLVMSNRPIETILLTWDPQGRPMIQKSCSPLTEPNMNFFKCAERALLSVTKIVWNGASPEELFISSSIDIIPLLLTLSHGWCFTRMPKDFDNIRDIAWLKMSPYFTMGQYVAGKNLIILKYTVRIKILFFEC